MVARRKSAEPAAGRRTGALTSEEASVFAAIRALAAKGNVAVSVEELRTCLSMGDPALRSLLKSLESLGYIQALASDEIRIELGPRALREAGLWRMVDDGLANWSGGKPKGSTHPVKVSPGPPVSDYVIQDRR